MKQVKNMAKGKQITQEFARIEMTSESDAVHSRFCPEDTEAVRKYEKENYYYCPQCKLYFAPSYQGLYIHFNHPIVRHHTCGSCFYCKGGVYEYHLNVEFRIYHNCKEHSDKGVEN